MRRAALQRDGQAAAPARALRDHGRRAVGAVVDSAPRSLAEVVEQLASPYAQEGFSPLTGAGALVVDMQTDVSGLDAAALDELRAALFRLPCAVLGVGAEHASPTAVALVDRFDVTAADPAELDRVFDTLRNAPLASLALVQLLRHGVGLDVERGLFAESLVFSTLQGGPEFAAWLAARGAGRPPREELGPAVLVERTGPRLLLTLNRPKRHNAFSSEMRDALAEGLRVAVGDPSIEEIELRGAGRSFSGGGDLDEFGSHPDPATAHAVRSTRSPAQLMAQCGPRVHAFVHGACVGAGTELPAFAARVVAAPDAYFVLPETRMGLVPGAGGTVSLPRRIGRQRTAWLALSGERIDAETAWRWGLVDDLAAAPAGP